MKKRFTSITATTFLLLFLFGASASCKKNAAEAPVVNNDTTTRPTGLPAGDNYTELVGANGGLVISEDGLIEIDIPAGALNQETEIGIQPLKNTAITGIGNSYRLTPHGSVFKKKVTIRFHYWKYHRQLSNPYAAEIAFQDEKGKWICIGGAVNDTAQKIISVETDHFSDWALIESMELSPQIKTIGLGESVTLKALRYVHPQDGDDWVVPLTNPAAGTGEPTKIEEKYIVGWTLDGPGKLAPNGAEAVYTAPALSPEENTTATITLELNVDGKQVLLISTIYLVKDGIHISVDCKPWQTYAAIAVRMDDIFRFSLSNLRTSTDDPQIVFTWPETDAKKTDGIYSWSMHDEDESDVVFEYHEPDLRHMYISMFEDAGRSFDSGGFMSVEESEEGGKKYISGVFAIDNAGRREAATGQQIATAGIMGTFKVQRVW